MKKKLLMALAAALALVSLNVGLVGATQEYPPKPTNPTLSGTGACQSDGSFKITWVVDNTKDPLSYKVTTSSNTAVVPVGTSVPKDQTESFYQTADGTQAGSFSLDLKLKATYYDMDKHMDKDDEHDVYKDLKATVYLREACPQPVVTTTVAATPAAPQVTVPVKAVHAGAGGSQIAALLGLSGSLAVIGFGIRRFVKAQ